MSKKTVLRAIGTASLRAGVALAALAISANAFAQAAPEVSADPAPDDKEIVVTGTSIRGIAPAGSAVVGLTKEQIEATGSASSNQVLTNLPQVANFFNALPTVGANSGGGNAGLQINRPNLRNLPASSSSGQTLILIDGHRIVGAGTTMIAIDPDVVSPSILERVEAITDGGSAVYGSDAIGGVINFITRRRFDGLQVSGHYGFADDYTTYDATATVGKDWGSGSIWASYAYAKHDALFGYDRDWIKSIDWNTGKGLTINCTPGNVSVSTRTYPLPGLVLGSANTCDANEFNTVYPAETRHYVNAGLSQDLNDAIKVDIRALYMHRFDLTNGGPFGNANSTVTITSTNPYYRPLPAPDATATQTVRFDYAPIFGNAAARQKTRLDTWQVTPSLSAEIFGTWQARALFSYGESISKFDNLVINGTTQAALARGTTLTTALNPYDLTATQNKALFDTLLAHNISRGENQLTNARLVLDGPLMALPGGDIRAAVGVEYMRNRFSNAATNQATFTLLPALLYTQSVKSAFGELQIPLFGNSNATTLMHALNVSVSGRYDEYNDFGHTFNPKVGVTWEPVDWMTVRGFWGESFNAPNPAEELQTFSSALLALPGGLAPAGTVIPAGSFSILWRAGAAPGLQPQTSKNWSAGGEIRPPFLPGLALSGSYYHITFNNMLGVPDVSNNFANYFALYPDLYILNPTAAQLTAIALQTPAGLTPINQFLQPGGPKVISILDIRTRNLGSARLAGIDFEARYVTATGFGSVDARLRGNYQLGFDIRPSRLAAYTSTIRRGISRLKLSAVLGANVGNFRAQATLNHSAGYDVTRTATLPQDHVSAYNVVNLFFRYDVKGSGIGQNLSFSLNIDNVLDQDPPVYKLGDGLARGYANGLTLGRLFQFGVSKKF